MFSWILAILLQAKVDYPQLLVLFMGPWTWLLKASPENHLPKVCFAQLKTRFINTPACFNPASAGSYLIYQAGIN